MGAIKAGIYFIIRADNTNITFQGGFSNEHW